MREIYEIYDIINKNSIISDVNFIVWNRKFDTIMSSNNFIDKIKVIVSILDGVSTSGDLNRIEILKKKVPLKLKLIKELLNVKEKDKNLVEETEDGLSFFEFSDKYKDVINKIYLDALNEK